VPGTILDEHDWIICSKLEEFVHIGWTTMWILKRFLCLWNSRAGQENWTRESWPNRERLEIGKINIIHFPLINPNEVLLPPFNIKV